MRALLLLMALVVGGCGDDDGVTKPPDMAQPVLGLSCGETRCRGTCGSCEPFAGGICTEACTLATPSCPFGGKCRPLYVSDGGYHEELSGDCAGFDGVCGG